MRLVFNLMQRVVLRRFVATRQDMEEILRDTGEIVSETGETISNNLISSMIAFWIYKRNFPQIFPDEEINYSKKKASKAWNTAIIERNINHILTHRLASVAFINEYNRLSHKMKQIDAFIEATKNTIVKPVLRRKYSDLSVHFDDIIQDLHDEFKDALQANPFVVNYWSAYARTITIRFMYRFIKKYRKKTSIEISIHETLDDESDPESLLHYRGGEPVPSAEKEFFNSELWLSLINNYNKFHEKWIMTGKINICFSQRFIVRRMIQAAINKEQEKDIISYICREIYRYAYDRIWTRAGNLERFVYLYHFHYEMSFNEIYDLLDKNEFVWAVFNCIRTSWSKDLVIGIYKKFKERHDRMLFYRLFQEDVDDIRFIMALYYLLKIDISGFSEIVFWWGKLKGIKFNGDIEDIGCIAGIKDEIQELFDSGKAHIRGWIKKQIKKIFKQMKEEGLI